MDETLISLLFCFRIDACLTVVLGLSKIGIFKTIFPIILYFYHNSPFYFTIGLVSFIQRTILQLSEVISVVAVSYAGRKT